MKSVIAASAARAPRAYPTSFRSRKGVTHATADSVSRDSSNPYSSNAFQKAASSSWMNKNGRSLHASSIAHRRVTRKSTIVRAVAAPSRSVTIVEKEFPLPNGCRVKVCVDEVPEGQHITLRTNLQAGRLLLHWGVEGGKDYRGGWRLPSGDARPSGTVSYKERALQTPWDNVDGEMQLKISLLGDEASDAFNFVLKDAATNTWWDHYGSNFKVPLRIPDAADPPPIPELPQELCNIWAYVKWEYAGSPRRSQAEAQVEYQNAVNEMNSLMAGGRPLSELWKVARGEIRYSEYVVNTIQPTLQGRTKPPQEVKAPPAAPKPAPPPPPAAAPVPAAVAPPPPPPPPAPAPVAVPPIPQELVNIKAYLMWEQAGKPMGADFGQQARSTLEQELRSGRTLKELEDQLKGPPAAASAAPPKAAAPPRAAPAAPPQLGQPLGVNFRNPLDMIKKDIAPTLSVEKEKKQQRVMEFLVQRAAVDPNTLWRRLFSLGARSELLVVVRKPQGPEGPTRVSIITDLADSAVLHWGMTRPGSRDWLRPPMSFRTEKTKSLENGIALETPLDLCHDDECDVELLGARVPLQRVTLDFQPEHEFGGLTFVLRSGDSTMWWRDGSGNFFVPVPSLSVPEVKDPTMDIKDDLTRTIVELEASAHQWTLMHRYNKCADLINEVMSGYHTTLSQAEYMARIYVVLRYSSSRQLTWQRNYNTQPRILSAAQDRLTNTIAHAHSKTTGWSQEWARLMLSTVGKGGDGQRIRDEILHIMHRNGIPEKKGLWMEEWHQKLHNNTTPDDVPICEAYIAFLESNGDVNRYWRVLSDAGISRQRLESFDRAIVTEPQFYPDKKNALIHDFRNYLAILKAVHSGADLQASAKEAGGKLPNNVRGYLGYVLSHLGDSQILPFIEAAVEARTELSHSMTGDRELLYLDLALESAIRGAAERGLGSLGFGAAALMAPLLQNVALSLGNNEEICFCLKAWNSLPTSVKAGGRPSREDALLAVAVLNRIRRAVSEISDTIIHYIEEFNGQFGPAVKSDPWFVEVFPEEVVRGSAAFAVSLAITNIEPTLRNAAALGSWQVISPVEAAGRVEVVPNLHEVQDMVYDEPTVLIAQHVTGEEEIPEGAVAVLTPDAPDVLSHVSVRARNMKVLFATCHEEEPLDSIRAKAGQYLRFTTTAAGAVLWQEYTPEEHGHKDGKAASIVPLTKISIPKWCGKWVVNMDEYRDNVVGAKSKNLAGLRGKLPEWIQLPASVTLPFGCFEQVLEAPENRQIKQELQTTVDKVKAISRGEHSNGNGVTSPSTLLAQCRELAMKVQIPQEVKQQLTNNMQAAGIPVPENEERWQLAFDAIRGVWASKFNDRAYYSLRKIGLEFDAVRMAVLCQRVVPAQYAFVIHTKNPSNNDAGEVFCELVKGLGESLVSGMVPGSSVAFKAKKDALDAPEVLCYASKSEGMFVRESLIFRSDSNGEDLEGYAGAGLYESITMDQTETKKVDYMEDKLVQDTRFRNDLLSRICKVGFAIEQALGSHQDVEGVVAPDGTITVVQTRPQV